MRLHSVVLFTKTKLATNQISASNTQTNTQSGTCSLHATFQHASKTQVHSFHISSDSDRFQLDQQGFFHLGESCNVYYIFRWKLPYLCLLREVFLRSSKTKRFLQPLRQRLSKVLPSSTKSSLVNNKSHNLIY